MTILKRLRRWLFGRTEEEQLVHMMTRNPHNPPTATIGGMTCPVCDKWIEDEDGVKEQWTEHVEGHGLTVHWPEDGPR